MISPAPHAHFSRPKLEGKTAIVTGAGTGIGEAIAHKFAREGAQVVVAGLSDDPVDDVVMAISDSGGQAVGFGGDLSEQPNALACVRLALDTFGKLDVLINNAGYFPVMAELQDYPFDMYLQMMRWNCDSAFFMTKAALPHLQQTRGCIVSAGSEAGMIGLANNAPYGATKGWMHAFMRGIAVEQAKYGVRANCVCPGPIDTAWTHADTGPMTRKMEKMVVDATPMGRRGTPEEVANVYCFLASNEASYVTGALYTVDGGITVAKGAVGKEVSSDLRKEPQGVLNLRHSLEGLENKPTAELM
jgi:NAD(P)-dependent dehydrogenase (short-subunit alcohol dehydrogenase family)